MKRSFPLFKWTFFGVFFVFVGVILTVVLLTHMPKNGSPKKESAHLVER